MPNPQNLKPFKPGEDKRRNKNGRPPKLPQLDVLLAKVLSKETRGKTAAEQIIEAMRKQANKGNVRAAELILDRSFGKVPQAIQLPDGPLMEATIFVLPNGRKVQI